MRKFLAWTVFSVAVFLAASLAANAFLQHMQEAAARDTARALFTAIQVGQIVGAAMTGHYPSPKDAAVRINPHCTDSAPGVVCEAKGPRLDIIERAALGLRPDGEPVGEYDFHREFTSPRWFASAFEK